jgi:YVTN family beta-propeller protein
VSVVDIANYKVITTLKVENHPYTIALAAGRIFVANQHSDSISVFNALDFNPLGVIKVGEYPEGLSASRDEQFVYVTNWFSNELWSLNTSTLAVVGKGTTSDGPRAFGSFVRSTP